MKASPAVPGFYGLYFRAIEPLLLITLFADVADVISWWPGSTWSRLQPLPVSTPVHNAGPADPRTVMAVWQLGNCYVVLALFLLFISRAVHDALPNNPVAHERIFGASLTALALTDVINILATFFSLPEELRYKPSSWQPVIHRNIFFVAFTLSIRLAWFMGIGRTRYYYGVSKPTVIPSAARGAFSPSLAIPPTMPGSTMSTIPVVGDIGTPPSTSSPSIPPFSTPASTLSTLPPVLLDPPSGPQGSSVTLAGSRQKHSVSGFTAASKPFKPTVAISEMQDSVNQLADSLDILGSPPVDPKAMVLSTASKLLQERKDELSSHDMVSMLFHFQKNLAAAEIYLTLEDADIRKLWLSRMLRTN